MMPNLWLYFVILSLSQFCESLDKEKIITAYGVVGGGVELGCNTSSLRPENYPMLVMWFKDNNLNPFYSYDARQSSSSVGSHWSDSSISGRVTFRKHGEDSEDKETRSNNSLSVLTIHKLREEDQGVYRCRVDFRQAPTFHSEVILEIFVPPAKPLLIDEEGNQVKRVFGPFFEGEQVTLSCEVTGGTPKPYLSWIKNGEPIKAMTEVSSGSAVTSKLKLNALRRVDNNQSVTCLTNNNDLSPPIETSVTIVMNLPPLAVSISNKMRKLLAGTDYNFSCLAQGHSPSVEFRWFLGDVNIATSSYQQKNDLSLFQFRPSIADHGRTLRCQALNPFMPLQSIQDTLVLDIYYKPVLTVRLGHGIVEDRIIEGSDVYLECRVNSRPKTDSIVWMKDDSEVRQDLSRGRLVSGTSLVLQNISRIDKGKYSCVAQNSEGRSSSNLVKIQVKYRPVCRSLTPEVMAVSEGEQVMVPCRVAADPELLTFRWSFNSSDNEEFIDLPASQFVSNRTVSLLQFNLHSERDYGTVQCWAQNSIGRQIEPCYVQLVRKDSPASPRGCSMVDISSSAVGVECILTRAGAGGTVFVLELYQDSQLTQLVHNSSNSRPKWKLEDLSAGEQYTARIYASDVGGQSRPVMVKVSPHQESSRFLILPPEEDASYDYNDPSFDPIDGGEESQSLPFSLKVILFTLVTIALILIVFSASVGAICRIQCKFVEDSARLNVKTQSTATSPMGSSSSMGTPDIINITQQSIPPSPTAASDFFPHHQHLYPSGSQNLFSGSTKGQDFHLKSTEALINSETNTFRSENVSFSSLEILSSGDPMLPALAPLVTSPSIPSFYSSSTMPRLRQRTDQAPGPEIVTMGEWTPRKLEKQRSVTFASIDLLEPIEEDFPQESRV